MKKIFLTVVLLFLFIFPYNIFLSAAVTFVQINTPVTTGPSVTSKNLNSITLTAGNALVVYASYYQLTNLITITASDGGDTITCDSGNNNYINNTYDIVSCVALNVVGGSTTVGLTFTGTGNGNYVTAWAKEYSGVATTSARDSSANGLAQQGSGTTTTSGSFTTTQAAEVISCGMVVTNNTDTWTVGTIGGVTATQRLNTNSVGSEQDEDLVVSSIQTGITATGINTSSAASAINCMGLKAAGGSAAPKGSFLLGFPG